MVEHKIKIKENLNITDLARTKKKNTISLKVEDGVYSKFKENLTLVGVKVSDVINEFMKRVNIAFKDGGGEIVIGINYKKEGVNNN